MNSPQIGIGAVILSENKDKVLLILRKKEPEANTWSVPGGKVELYESLEEATIREIKEEVGLDIIVKDILCTSETINADNKEHWISVIYNAEIVDGKASICEPHAIADLRWIDLHNLPDNIACFAKPALNKLQQI